MDPAVRCWSPPETRDVPRRADPRRRPRDLWEWSRRARRASTRTAHPDARGKFPGPSSCGETTTNPRSPPHASSPLAIEGDLERVAGGHSAPLREQLASSAAHRAEKLVGHSERRTRQPVLRVVDLDLPVEIIRCRSFARGALDIEQTDDHLGEK